MNDKTEFQQRVESELRELDARIEKFEAKLSGAQADAKVKYEQTLRDLRSKRSDVQTRFDELKSASGSAWEELKSGFDGAWRNLQSGVRDAADKFN